MEELTKRQKKELLLKISPMVANQIRMLYTPRETAVYTLSEIHKECGLTENRLSEIATGVKTVYENALLLLAKGGIVNVSALLKKSNLTEAERDYLETYEVFQNKELLNAIKACKRSGQNPAEILQRSIIAEK